MKPAMTDARYVALTDDVERRRAGLGWPKSKLARRLRRDPSLIGRAIAGAPAMPFLLTKALAVLTKEEARRADKATKNGSLSSRPGVRHGD